MIQLLSEHLQAIHNHAESTYPEECCGIIFGHLLGDDKTTVEVMPTENAWEPEAAIDFPGDVKEYSKRRRYAIAPLVMLQAQKQARERCLDIVGIYHSHPDYQAIPSEFDRMCAWQEYSYIIVSVENGEATQTNSWCLDDSHQFQAEALAVNS
ncbi:MAG: M67 family metallopeptidase [Nostocaceae cyanobacterium]|nr:M67 family metallopeptidase [Nostocaceae cyanobacterium]